MSAPEKKQKNGSQAVDSAAVVRILDAAINRSCEGLRVVEDYCRMVLEDRFLSQELKKLRHDLVALAVSSTRDRVYWLAIANSMSVERSKRMPNTVAKISKVFSLSLIHI